MDAKNNRPIQKPSPWLARRNLADRKSRELCFSAHELLRTVLVIQYDIAKLYPMEVGGSRGRLSLFTGHKICKKGSGKSGCSVFNK